jgi:photosystem II stability/assembly factor-like uncharacterized protein
MKAKILLALIIIASGLQSNAQDWSVQTSGVNKIFRDVFFISESQGWIVGDQSTILTSLDGGTTWTPQATTIGSTTLTSVFFTSPTKGWIVGSDETLLTTNDGGNNWTVVTNTLGNQNLYHDILFTSPDTGYIAGTFGATGYIKRTYDGGLTWQTANVSKGMDAMHFTSNLKGWACGSRGLIVATTDGGVTWTEQTTAGANQTFNLYGIFMVSDTEGWACGNPTTFLYTTDGGTTWASKAAGTNAGKTDVHFINSQVGYNITTSSLGGSTPIRSTTDGGTTWVTDTLWLPTLYKMYFYNDTLAWAVGESGKVVRFGTPNVPLAAKNIAPDSNISIYPNPTNNYLTINANQNIVKAEIYNVNGKLETTTTGNINTINTGTLPSGFYIIKLTGQSGNLITKKFTKL